MKRLQTFLETIRALPEEARRLLAGLLFVVAAIIIFSGWSITMSSRLTVISGETVSPATLIGPTDLEDVPQGEETLSPLEGITESFRSLQSVIGPTDTGKSGLASITTFFEKAWRYIYDPLK